LRQSFFDNTLPEHEFAVQYGKPRAELPVDLIKEWHKQGNSLRDIVNKLREIGITSSKDTVRRRLGK